MSTGRTRSLHEFLGGPPGGPRRFVTTMKIKIAHLKNPVLGWDINVNVEADAGQHISQVVVKVNGLPEINESPDDLDSWEQQLVQKGIFPGDNEVEVVVSDQNGDESRAQQKWS